MANSILLAFLLLLLLLPFQYSSSFSLSVEKLKEDVIVSPNGTFTAGFYPVGENAYCFSIWFTKLAYKHGQNATIVWMANRDQPVNGKGSKLSLLKNGNLILTDAGQFIVWTTNTNSSNQLEFLLYDTGNLVLQEQNNGFILWQSFDYPTDTLLPDQNFTRYMKLVSSRRESNYSSGFYKLFFDNDNVLRLLYDGPQVSSVYWPDPWLLAWDAGRSTYNSSRVAALDRLGKFSSSDGFTLKTLDYGTVLQRRLTLDHDGNLRVYSWKKGQDMWLISGQAKQQACKIHGICGPNSVCSVDPSAGSRCRCLPGFSMVNNEDWSQGCKPNFQLPCNNNNTESRFLFLPHVAFYGYDYNYHENYTFEQCKLLCLQLCECVGFQYDPFESASVFRCYIKSQLLNGYQSLDFTGSSFLRLPESRTFSFEKNPIKDNSLVCSRNGTELERSYLNDKENGSVKFMLWFACGLGGIEIVCIFLVLCFLIRNRKHLGEDSKGYVLAAETGFQRFSYSELKQATKGFSQEIGRGAGGIVYKGVLSDNRVAAIKQLYEANQGESEFLAEVSIIGRLNHMNLIGMWGYCAEGKHRLLVYEYMENGSLAENISSNSLDWGKRYSIALGTARGLAYLHEECLEWILHCDIKPQNILLDSDFQPKVADFGLSKLLHRNDLNNSSFSRIRGTRGYMAPEWVFNLPITSKVDVYSYGIVALEMITGKSPMASIQIAEGAESHHERLVTWVREKRRKGSEVESWVEKIIDTALGSNYDINKMEILATLALECVEEERDARPSMSQIVERLQSYEHDS
ncbi:putative receptor protein kinase ZmPK1 [Gastrolobium bilobum]|uniref:putative receptor protein kinase ZmPK1 n=1 Tax=Gastrolobium bilobum TaxID=150636 RepID=UPI002AB0B6C5|nr:putative receptor protein kinase ZmPK1 [Gastrolobium bilobum]